MRKPLTPEQKQVKVINQKIRRLAVKLGTENELYKEYVNTIMRNFDIRLSEIKGAKNRVIQIQNKATDYNDFQRQTINKLTGMKSYNDLKKISVKRLKKSGIKKPTEKEIKEDIEENDFFRAEVDETLTAIYKEIIEGKLPPDIYDMYEHMRSHNTSNNEIHNLVDSVKRWRELKQQLIDISEKIKSLDYIDEYIAQLMYNANGGRLTLSECEQALETLTKYYYEEREQE